MKTHGILVLAVVLGACTGATPAPTLSPLATSVWVGEPASPIGDGTQPAESQSGSGTTTLTSATSARASSRGDAIGSKAADVEEASGSPRSSGADHDSLPRNLNMTPRPINTGDPCGDCARGR
jgi:hypothetical protein